MAEAAEQLLTATGWLPALLRTPKSDQDRLGETLNQQSGATFRMAAD